jgi:hypothetical protein
VSVATAQYALLTYPQSSSIAFMTSAPNVAKPARTSAARIRRWFLRYFQTRLISSATFSTTSRHAKQESSSSSEPLNDEYPSLESLEPPFGSINSMTCCAGFRDVPPAPPPARALRDRSTFVFNFRNCVSISARLARSNFIAISL